MGKSAFPQVVPKLGTECVLVQDVFGVHLAKRYGSPSSQAQRAGKNFRFARAHRLWPRCNEECGGRSFREVPEHRRCVFDPSRAFPGALAPALPPQRVFTLASGGVGAKGLGGLILRRFGNATLIWARCSDIHRAFCCLPRLPQAW